MSPNNHRSMVKEKDDFYSDWFFHLNITMFFAHNDYKEVLSSEDLAQHTVVWII